MYLTVMLMNSIFSSKIFFAFHFQVMSQMGMPTANEDGEPVSPEQMLAFLEAAGAGDLLGEEDSADDEDGELIGDSADEEGSDEDLAAGEGPTFEDVTDEATPSAESADKTPAANGEAKVEVDVN